MAPPPPPLVNSPINLIPRHSISHQAKRHTQFGLHIPVPRLIVEEQHIRKRYLLPILPQRSLQPLKVCGFAAGENLRIYKIAFGFRLLLILFLCLTAARIWNNQPPEHVPRQLGSRSSTGEGHGDVGAAGGVEDGGDVTVEGEGFAPPVNHDCVVLLGFDGRGNMCVHPEGP